MIDALLGTGRDVPPLRRLRFLLPLVLLPLVLGACTPPPAAPIPPPEARIGVRTIGGVDEFYLRGSGERFVPRGHNYVKFTAVDDPIFGPTVLNLVLSTLRFDPDEVRRDFRAMRDAGFNVVRVMLETCADSGCIGGPGLTLRSAYLDNMATMLEIGEEEGIYIWFTSNTLPDSGVYLERAFGSGVESDFLTPANVAAYEDYFLDLFRGLIARGARLEQMFSFEIRNEQWYDLRSWPWSESSGTFTAANGERYDLADPGCRRIRVDRPTNTVPPAPSGTPRCCRS